MAECVALLLILGIVRLASGIVSMCRVLLVLEPASLIES